METQYHGANLEDNSHIDEKHEYFVTTVINQTMFFPLQPQQKNA